MEHRILDSARGSRLVTTAEVFSRSNTVTTLSYEAGRAHALETRQSVGYGLRLVRSGKLGFSATTSPERYEELVSAALATAQYGEEVKFEFPGYAELPKPVVFNNRNMLLPAERLKLTSEKVIELCQDLVPDMKVDLQIQRGYSTTRIVNSSGLDCSYDQTECCLLFSGLLIIDSSLVWLSDFVNLNREYNFNAEAFVRQLALRADQCYRQARVAGGRYPCILTNEAAVDLIGHIAPAVSGLAQEKGISPLIGKLDEKLFDDKLTVWDDGLQDHAFRSAPFDGEGVPQQKTPLIVHGVFKNFLYDLRTGAAAGRASTGNAARSYAALPQPSVTNLIVRPGRLKLEQAIAGMTEGIVIYSTVGAGQSNVLAGDFSFGVGLGFKVEKGDVVGRVKDVMVAGNIYEAGRELVGLGAVPYDAGGAQVPFLYFPALSFAAR